MKFNFYPLVLLLLILLFDPFLEVSLVVAGVVAVGFVVDTSVAFAWAFGYGLVYDVRQLHLLGGTSLAAVAVVLVIGLIRLQSEQRQVLSVLIVSIVTGLGWQLWRQPPLDVGVLLLQVGVSMGMWWVMARVGGREGVYLRNS